MGHDSGGVGKWIAGIVASIISGVAVYYLTVASKQAGPIPTSDPTPTVSPSLDLQPSPKLTTPPTSVQPIEFTILNELNPIQVSENVQIYIEGQPVANIVVNQQQVTASAKVQVPKSGIYNYTVLADCVFINQFGQIDRQQGRGDGVIEVSDGSIFMLTITPSGIKLFPR